MRNCESIRDICAELRAAGTGGYVPHNVVRLADRIELAAERDAGRGDPVTGTGGVTRNCDRFGTAATAAAAFSGFCRRQDRAAYCRGRSCDECALAWAFAVARDSV